MNDLDLWVLIAFIAIFYISMITLLVLWTEIKYDEYMASYRKERNRQQEWDRKFSEQENVARSLRLKKRSRSVTKRNGS